MTICLKTQKKKKTYGKLLEIRLFRHKSIHKKQIEKMRKTAKIINYQNNALRTVRKTKKLVRYKNYLESKILYLGLRWKSKRIFY